MTGEGLMVFEVDDFALQPQSALLGKESDHLPKLEGVTLRRGVVSFFALALIRGIQV